MATGVLYWQKRKKSQPVMLGYTVGSDSKVVGVCRQLC